MNFSLSIPYVLSLNYSRDICAKFSSSKFLQETHESQRRHAWHALGSFDNLEVRADLDLEAMRERIEKERRTEADGSDLAIGAHSGLILVPFDDFFDTIEKEQRQGTDKEAQSYREFVSRVVMHMNAETIATDEIRREFPLLVVCRFYLSAIAYELESSFRGVLTAIDCMRDILHEEADKYRDNASGFGGVLPNKESLRFFRTLGSPDIALLVLPKTPEELFGLHHFLDQIRETKLQTLVTAVAETLLKLETRDGQNARELLRKGEHHPGHAFASIDDTLSFRTPLLPNLDAKQLTETTNASTSLVDAEFQYSSGRTKDEDRKRESQLGFRLTFKLRLDCGHESEFLSYFRQYASEVHFDKADNSENPYRFGG